MYDLRSKFTTGGGKIHPGGYVHVRFGDPNMPMSVRRQYAEGNGLAIWHSELMRFGKMDGVAAHVTKQRLLSIRDTRGRFLGCVTGDKAIPVNVYPGFIAANGYVSHTLEEGLTSSPKAFQEIVERWEEHMCTAIDKANSGDHPGITDNSPFTRVTDQFTKHQRVITISPMLSTKDGDGTMVYDLAGNRFASVTHYPLSYRKWLPNSHLAEHSRSGEYITLAA